MEDKRLLREIWHTIDPNHIIGEDTPRTTKNKVLRDRLKERKLAEDKERMKRKLNQLRRAGTLHTLTKGERSFAVVHCEFRGQ